MDIDIKDKASKGFKWNAIERFLSHLLSLVIGVVLARILVPEDFGLLGMLVIFTTIASIFVESGMGSGLIQKQNKTAQDYSTVFVFNLFVAILIYVILFLIAPYVSDFYNEPRLKNLLRFLGLNIIFGALVTIQRTKLVIDLNFKVLAKINLCSTLLSGSLAIFLAWYGIGYWALAYQILFSTFFSIIFFYFLGNWKYCFTFSKNSFKQLFGFGSRLLFAAIYAQALRNIYDVFIGKYYSGSDLGFYSRSIKFTELISGTVNGVVQQVSYPIISSMRSNPDRMIDLFRSFIKVTAFIIFPAMVLLSLLAEAIVLNLLGEKWSEVIPLLQWMPFARIFYPASALNMNLLNAIGRSDLFLKVDLSKLPLNLFAMVITLPLGIKAMVIGHVVTSFIAYFINAYLLRKFFNYGSIKQLKDMAPSIINSLLMGLMIYLLLLFIDNQLLKLIIGIFLGAVIYVILAFVQKNKELEELYDIIKRW